MWKAHREISSLHSFLVDFFWSFFPGAMFFFGIFLNETQDIHPKSLVNKNDLTPPKGVPIKMLILALKVGGYPLGGFFMAPLTVALIFQFPTMCQDGS